MPRADEGGETSPWARPVRKRNALRQGFATRGVLPLSTRVGWGQSPALSTQPSGSSTISSGSAPTLLWSSYETQDNGVFLGRPYDE